MIVAHANHLVAAGHDVCIITARMDTVFIVDPRVSIKRLASTTKLGTILSALKTEDTFDLVVADIIVMACVLFLRNTNRVVYFAQDYDESYYSSLVVKLIIRFIYGIGLVMFNIPVIAVSERLAELLRKRFHARVTVAENGLDAFVFYPDADPNLVSAKENRKAVLLLARRDRRKGFDIAQDVVKCLSGSDLGLFEVWTVGESCTGLFPDYVHRDFDCLSEEILRRVFSSADIFLYPTRHEGFGLMPLEAMKCGCAVVTTTAVPYVVHGENALVSQIGENEKLTDYLKELLENDDFRSVLIEAGKKFAGKYSLAASTEKFEIALTRMSRR